MLCRFATSLPQLLCLRALYGVAVGVSMHSSPPYLAETSPAPVRGLVFCAKEGMIVAGILKGYMVRPWAQQQVQPGAIWSCLMLLRRDSLPSPCTGALLQCCVLFFQRYCADPCPDTLNPNPYQNQPKHLHAAKVSLSPQKRLRFPPLDTSPAHHSTFLLPFSINIKRPCQASFLNEPLPAASPFRSPTPWGRRPRAGGACTWLQRQ